MAATTRSSATLRPQDVIELPEGADSVDYELTENGNGTKTISNGTHSVTFTGDVPPQFLTDGPVGDEEDDDETTLSTNDSR